MRHELTFEASPALGDAALRCILRRRGRLIGPAALVLLPILLALLASDPAWRLPAALLAGAALMLFVIFFLAVWHRRRLRRRFFAQASHLTVRIAMDEEGLFVATGLGETRLPWRLFERVWRCDDVVLLFHQGWQYVAIPAAAAPAAAIEYAEARIREAKRGAR